MSVHAEQALLGFLIAREELAIRAKVLGQLDSDDFTDAETRAVFSTIGALHDNELTIDVITISEAMGDPREWINKLGNWVRESPLNSGTVPSYVAKVRRTTAEREARKIAHDLIDTGDIGEAMRALMDLNTISRDDAHACTSAEVMNSTIDYLAKRESGEIKFTSTGWKHLDEQIGGWMPGTQVVVGGRAKMGKTSWMLNAMKNLSVPYGCMSIEMSREQLGQKQITVQSQVPSGVLRDIHGPIDQGHWKKIMSGAKTIGDSPGYFNFKGGATLNEVKAEARQMRYEHGIEVFFIDYLQRIRLPGANRFDRVGEIALSLAELAKELNITVISLAQVKRDVDTRVAKELAPTGALHECGLLNAVPLLGDFADSSEIEKEMAVGITLYRPEVHHPHDPRAQNIIIQNVCANRYGKVGYIRNSWDGPTQIIGDYVNRPYRFTGEE